MIIPPVGVEGKSSDPLVRGDRGPLDALAAALPSGEVGARALVHQRYQLALTAGLVTDVFDTDTTSGMFTTEAGYVDLDDDDRWWVPSGLVTPDPAAFYQPLTLTDPWSQTTTVTWDDHALFPVEVEDALGLVTTATHDYAHLQPHTVTDPNGTVSEAAYDALGRLLATAVRNGSDGDAAESWSTELTYVDDVLPASVRTRQRTTHGGATWLEAVAYSDGGGNVIQTKTRVAPGQAPALVEGDVVWSAADPRWVGSGRTVFDNKGQPIKQYEPFFAHSDAFEAEGELAEWGVTPVLRYDPAGRLVRVDLPDGSHRRVDFDAWSIVSFDECDTEAEGDHEDTPTTSQLDALGRPVRVRETPDGTAVYETRLVLDVTGNPTAVIDPRGNTVQTQAFDLLGRPLRTVSPEDGTTRVLFDVAGQPVRTWKTGGPHLQATFDEGRRPVSLLADGVRVHHTVYGDTLQSPPAHSLGRPVQVWDTAGRLAFVYDFKGRTVEQTRQVTVDITQAIDWDTLDEELLDEETFTVETAYDALDRPTSQTAPDGAVTALTYEASGRLFSVEVDATAVVTGITYDARGQRLVADYGNHTSTAYTYDPARFWLTRLHTTRASTSTHGAATLQDVTYTRDLVGNLTSIADDAQETLYFANTQVSATRAFVHDSLYRLVQATGREKDALAQTSHELPTSGAIPDSGNPALRRYTQSYQYDAVGNIIEMKHQLGSGGTVLWRRGYAYAAGSNRLLSSSLPGDDPDDPNDHSALYSYDARGALSNLPHLEGFTRDFRDQVRKVVLDLSGNEAWYAYDGAGQRVRKLVDKGAVTEERIYVGGWEVWRKRVNGTLDEERTTLHVMDGQRRVAMLETKTVADEEPVTTPVGRWRFQLDDHLGSAMGEADDEGGVFSYEELHPYGSVAWSAMDSALDVSARRYRYTGMERDEETGLQAHGVRLYAAWLGRWDRPDPIGLGDGVNRWGYVHGGVTRALDQSGHAEEDEARPDPRRSVPLSPEALRNGDPTHISAEMLATIGAHAKEAGRKEISFLLVGDAEDLSRPYDLVFLHVGTKSKVSVVVGDEQRKGIAALGVEAGGPFESPFSAGVGHTHPHSRRNVDFSLGDVRGFIHREPGKGAKWEVPNAPVGRVDLVVGLNRDRTVASAKVMYRDSIGLSSLAEAKSKISAPSMPDASRAHALIEELRGPQPHSSGGLQVDALGTALGIKVMFGSDNGGDSNVIELAELPRNYPTATSERRPQRRHSK